MLNEGKVIEKFVNQEHGIGEGRKKRTAVKLVEGQEQKFTLESSSSFYIRASDRLKQEIRY